MIAHTDLSTITTVRYSTKQLPDLSGCSWLILSNSLSRYDINACRNLIPCVTNLPFEQSVRTGAEIMETHSCHVTTSACWWGVCVQSAWKERCLLCVLFMRRGARVTSNDERYVHVLQPDYYEIRVDSVVWGLESAAYEILYLLWWGRVCTRCHINRWSPDCAYHSTAATFSITFRWTHNAACKQPTDRAAVLEGRLVADPWGKAATCFGSQSNMRLQQNLAPPHFCW
jgi:hypothetical protein